LAPVTYCIS